MRSRREDKLTLRITRFTLFRSLVLFLRSVSFSYSPSGAESQHQSLSILKHSRALVNTDPNVGRRGPRAVKHSGLFFFLGLFDVGPSPEGYEGYRGRGEKGCSLHLMLTSRMLEPLYCFVNC